jgi:hypothetical protein
MTTPQEPSPTPMPTTTTRHSRTWMPLRARCNATRHHLQQRL